MPAIIWITLITLFCSLLSLAAPVVLPASTYALTGFPFAVFPGNTEELADPGSIPFVVDQAPFFKGSPFLLPGPTSTLNSHTSSTPAVYITVTVSPPTITETATQTTTVTVTQSPPTPSAISSWSLPAKFADLSSFRITYFPAGQKNIKLDKDVKGNTQLAISYPKGSINPGHTNAPTGGVELYATPLDLSSAKSVTLTYRVYFPLNFNWRKGGKLPGLYGGKTGCSGGDEALDCFSTRLMWRAKGEGELYLYASRTAQTSALCSHPQSYCEAVYGISVGRGSFHFALGAWTTVKQTVTLNTPGIQDGQFTLEVNGAIVIHREDIFYGSSISQRRNVPVLAPVTYSDLKRVPFSGLFFSTFFGGHDASFASPANQVVHFAGFNMTINEL